MEATRCFPREQITAFLLGTLNDDEMRRIGDHLEGCPRCQNVADELESLPDDLRDLVRRPAPSRELLDEPQCRRALAKARALWPSFAASIPIRYDRGSLIAGRYEVVDVLGGPDKSGMGVVYVCRDGRDHRHCALKSFQDRILGNAQAAQVFRREAELWIALGHHPHIVSARTIRKPDGRLYLVLEYIERDEQGRNRLSDYFDGTPFPLKQTLIWAVQFCRGMEHALAHGLHCHRDIKPDNIMIDKGRLKITDFGLAKSLDGVSPGETTETPTLPMHGLTLVAAQEGSTCGTPPWMAPEQFGGAEHADVRNDVYSFGIVLFQMLSGGRLPFIADSRQEYAKLHRHASIPAIESPLSSVVDRCLAKRPEERYPDFASLRRDLEACAADSNVDVPVVEGLPETVERLKDWASSLCCLGRYEEAADFADRAVAKDPNHVPSWINRSVCYLGLHDARRALESAKQAIALDENDAFAQNNLACAYRRLEEWEDAISAAQRAIQLDPGLLAGWNTLGGLYQTCAKCPQDYQKAADCYGEALEIDPFFFDGWMNLAATHVCIGNLAEALRGYERAAQIDPADALAVERRDAFRKARGFVAVEE